MSLSTDAILEFRKSLFHDLRDELGTLKSCQTTMLLFASAGAGLFIGLVRSDFTDIGHFYLFLLPLVFLLPLWLIFYEKARTIARIVGFLRVQEKLYVSESSLALIGWESAMQDYWKKKHIWDDRKFDILFPKEDYKRKTLTSIYWVTVYLTFFFITSTCLILSGTLLSIPDLGKIFIAALFILFLSYAVLNQKIIRFSLWKFGMRLDKKPVIEHSDLSKILFESMIYSAVFWFLLIMGLRYLGYITSFSIKVECYIFGIFLGAFLFILTVALWMFRNLVKERYSYNMFEQRWQIILNIWIDKNSDKIEFIDWEKWDGKLPIQSAVPGSTSPAGTARPNCATPD